MSGGPFVTREQVATARAMGGEGSVRLYARPDTPYEGPYENVLAVFEDGEPRLIRPDGSDGPAEHLPVAFDGGRPVLTRLDGSRERLLLEWTVAPE